MKTMSESASASAIFSESSSADRWPIVESPPAPRPRVILSPIRILCGASDWRSACASVLQAMNSTPIISARIIRLTALLPPPPTPMTRISAKFSESERSGIGSLLRATLGQAYVIDRLGRIAGSTSRCRAGSGRVGGSIAPDRRRRTAVAADRSTARPTRVPACGSACTGGWPAAQPARKLRRTVRTALSAFGSSRQIDCHVPSASRPPTTGTVSDGEREERQDVVGAVAGRAVAVPVQPLLAWQQAIEGGEQVVVGAGADLDDDEPGRRVRARRPTAARRRRRRRRGTRRTRPVRSASAAAGPGPDRQLAACPTGRCSAARRGAGPARRRPAPTRSASARRRRGSRRPTGAARRPCCSSG